MKTSSLLHIILAKIKLFSRILYWPPPCWK